MTAKSDDTILRKYTAAQAKKGRTEYLKVHIKPAIKTIFENYPELKSAVLVLARQTDNPKTLAVKHEIGLSLNEDPDIDNWFESLSKPLPFNTGQSYKKLLEGKSTAQQAGILFDADGRSEIDAILERDVVWDSHGEAASLFYGFCPIGMTSKTDFQTSFLPFAVFRRGARGATKIEIVGEMTLPIYDGILPDTEVLEPESDAAIAHFAALEKLKFKEGNRQKFRSAKSTIKNSMLGKATANTLEDWRTPAVPQPPKEHKPASEFDILVSIVMLLIAGTLIIASLSFLGMEFDFGQATNDSD